MEVYNYDFGGVFIGVSLADKDPEITGQYLVPAMSTTLKPPEFGIDEVAIFDVVENQWNVVKVNQDVDKQALLIMQYNAIDAHIHSVIKNCGDYDNIGELAAYALLSDKYNIESKKVFSWVEKCHEIQADIKSGAKIFDSVDAVLAELPLFEL